MGYLSVFKQKYFLSGAKPFQAFLLDDLLLLLGLAKK